MILNYILKSFFYFFISAGFNAPTPASYPVKDTFVTVASANDCCNKCGATANCLGYSFVTTNGGCFLKNYSPFGNATPAPIVQDVNTITGIIIGLAG